MTEPSTVITSTSTAPNELDLAFIIDATGSMGSYINSAKESMRNIIQDIIISERCLLNVALILYRDHPPQDSTFVTKVHDFTSDAEKAKANIDAASASGGGDGPEAVTPALYAAIHNLTWRKDAVKIAVLIADAPPHGLEQNGDHWPNGDPSGHDPMECVATLAERAITLYTIGCEPTVSVYRDFFMALAFKTGGQYIPLNNSVNLASIIVGSAKEEISLERLIAQVHEEVAREAAARGGCIDEAELTRRIHEVMQSGGVKARRLKTGGLAGEKDIPVITPAAEELSTLKTLKEVREKWKPNHMTTSSLFATPASLFSAPVPATFTLPTASMTVKRTRTRSPTIRKTSAKRAKLTKVTVTMKKKPTRASASGARRSIRIALRVDGTKSEEVESATTSEDMDTSAAPPLSIPATKPATLRTHVSEIQLADDELLDVSQTRRLVRKCVARSKITSP